MEEKDWQDRFKYTSHMTFEKSHLVTVHSIRDWTYTAEEVFSEKWIPDLDVKTHELSRCWFLLEPFPYWDGIGHAYLTFEWSNGTALSFSIEARLRKHQKYSPITGLTNAYQLGYTWGTERDFLTERLIYKNHAIYMYPLDLSKERIRSLFCAAAEETNALHKRPKYYNSLTANCVNSLARLIGQQFPNILPYDPALHVPGFMDFFFMRKGLITASKNYLETRNQHDISKYREAIAGFATKGTHHDFSVSLRALLKSRMGF